MRDTMEFKCPDCGGYTFGSSLQADGSWERLCHGYVLSADPKELSRSCVFTWHQRDDWKYFIRTIYYDSKEEFDADNERRAGEMVVATIDGVTLAESTDKKLELVDISGKAHPQMTVAWHCLCGASGVSLIDEKTWNTGSATTDCLECKEVLYQSANELERARVESG